jgi:hypothetical protein
MFISDVAAYRVFVYALFSVQGGKKVKSVSALMPRRRIVLLPERVPSFISRGAPHQAA